MSTQQEQRRPRRLISYPEGARRLNVSDATFRRYVAAGRIHAIRVGPHRVAVEEAEIDRVIDEAEAAK